MVYPKRPDEIHRAFWLSFLVHYVHNRQGHFVNKLIKVFAKHCPILNLRMFLFNPIFTSDLDMKKLIELLRNKYFLAVVAFVVWMLFFDKNDIFSQYEYRSEVNKLQQERDFYVKETAIVKKDLNELDSNLNTAEKFAREKYFMKKDNEDVFVVVHTNNKKD